MEKKSVGRPLARAKTRQEVAREYGIDRKTFYQWLKRAKINLPLGLICPSNLNDIYCIYGNPHSLEHR